MLSSSPTIKAVLTAPQTEAKLGSILGDNPALLALYIKPANADSLSVFRSGGIIRDDVEQIASAITLTGENGAVSVGDPLSIGSNGERVMTFASAVTANGEPSSPRSSRSPRFGISPRPRSD